MISRILALLFRSMRLESRSLGVHLARFGLLVAIYVALVQTQWTVNTASAPGLNLLSWLL